MCSSVGTTGWIPNPSGQPSGQPSTWHLRTILSLFCMNWSELLTTNKLYSADIWTYISLKCVGSKSNFTCLFLWHVSNTTLFFPYFFLLPLSFSLQSFHYLFFSLTLFYYLSFIPPTYSFNLFLIYFAFFFYLILTTDTCQTHTHTHKVKHTFLCISTIRKWMWWQTCPAFLCWSFTQLSPF